MRITRRFLWIPSRKTEEPEMAGRRLLRDARVCSRNAFAAGNGHHPGETRNVGGAGRPLLARALGPGGRRAASAKPGNWPAGAARPGKAPPSHTWRGLASFCPARTPWQQPARQVRNCRAASRDDPGSRPAAGEGLSGCATTEGATAAGMPAAAPATRLVQERWVLAAGGVPVSRPKLRKAPSSNSADRHGYRRYSCAIWSARSWRPAHRASSKRRCAHPVRAAQPGKRSADRPVYKHVDYLCKTTPSLWARGEMLGIPPPGRPLIRVFSWENTSHTLCTQRKRNCPHATPQ